MIKDAENLDFLDIITILSFALQIQNNNEAIGISDVQKEIEKAVEDIHKHLMEQDAKIDLLLSGVKKQKTT